MPLGYGRITVYMTGYREIEVLGTGGFGEVFVCERTSDGAEFAKKRLLPNVDEEAKRRFDREIRLLAGMNHPNIVRVVAHGLEQDPMWYVMPRYKSSLQRLLPQLVGNEPRIKAVFGNILEAMEYAHEQGVIHRDLKPHNVLINSDDDVVVSDFGIGRKLDAESTRQTVSGFGMGTALYMAPEQWQDAKHADQRSDVFALGRMLYELYTGPLANMAQDVSGVPPGLAMVINRATHQDPTRRYADASALKRAYLAAVGDIPLETDMQLLNSFVERLSVPTTLNSDAADRFVELVVRYTRDDADLRQKVFMKLDATNLSVVVERDPEHLRPLVIRFLDAMGSESWGFDYCDTIGLKCAEIHRNLRDPEIRAAAIGCAMSVGAGHNRWGVLKTAAALIQGTKTPGERVMLIEMLETQKAWVLDTMREYVQIADLDSALMPFFENRS